MTNAETADRLTKAQAELDSVNAALGNVPANPGTSSLRGKQHAIRVNADIHRTAQLHEKKDRLEREIKALTAQIAEAGTGPVDPSTLKGAKFVRTRWGWHEVARVNKATVSVKNGSSWADRIAHSKILEVRHA